MAVFYIHELCLAVFLFGSVHIRGQEAGCNASVTEGGSAKLTFLLRNALNTSSDSFYAYVRRNKDPESDILRCFRLDASTNVQCTATTPQYKAGELVNHRLNMFIPNVTLDFDDIYVLRVYVNDSPESPISCTLTVKAKKSKERGQDKLLLIVLSVAGIAVLLIIVAAVIICWRRRRKRPGNETRYSTQRVEEGCRKPDTPTSFLTNEQGPETSLDMSLLSNTAEENNTNIRPETSLDMSLLSNTAEENNTNIRQEDTSPTLPTKTPATERNNEPTRFDNTKDMVRFDTSTEEKPKASFHDDLKRQPWYHGGTTNEQAQRLLVSDKNGHGSFLVIDSRIHNEYRLKVKVHDQIKTCFIRPSGKRFYIDQGLVFDSVTQLIDYYKTHSTSSLPAVLSTPCVR